MQNMIQNKQYIVYTFKTGCFSGTLDPKKLQTVLNQHSQQGWRFVRSIHETQKVFGIFQREAHFLIFEK